MTIWILNATTVVAMDIGGRPRPPISMATTFCRIQYPYNHKFYDMDIFGCTDYENDREMNELKKI